MNSDLRWLRSSADESMHVDQTQSAFERDFLADFHEKVFAPSLTDVREKNYSECQRVLQRTQLHSSLSPKPLSDTTIGISPAKLIVYEHVHLLPEEVRTSHSFVHSLTRAVSKGHLLTTRPRLSSCSRSIESGETETIAALPQRSCS